MSAVKILPHYTYEDYCLWEGRWELIEGIPFAMSPAPAPRHQWLAANIIRELGNSIKKAKCKECRVYDFVDIKIEEDTIVQPDVSIFCKSTFEKFFDFPPALAVEILSPATALKDRHNKYYLYQRFGIKYYLIVEEKSNELEIYCLENSKYLLQNFSPENPFTFSLSDDCKIDVVLKNIWE